MHESNVEKTFLDTHTIQKVPKLDRALLIVPECK